MNIFLTMPHRLVRSAMLVALVSPTLLIQTAHGHEYTALIKAKKYAEVERAINTKLAVEPNNPDALVAKTDLIIKEGKVSRLDEGVKIAEQCIAHNPKNSECHEALGSVLGVKAEKGGMMSAMGSLGKIRDSLKKAVELDPQNFRAISSLITFYLEVPGLMGGSTSKAKDLIAEAHKVSPAAAGVFQATLDLKEEHIEKARTGALAINVNAAPKLAELQNDVLIQIGLAYVREKQFVEAEKMFREVTQRFPDSSNAYLGLGRALQEQGKNKEALPQLEKSLNLDASASAFYRLGKVLQALGEKGKAVTAFEKSLSFTPELGKKTRADAEEQLKMLK
jgi:tetratricopeptide (TPR) repeat protein